MTTIRQAGPGSAPSPGIALRAARALLFGLVCVVLATVGHALAGGCPGSAAARCAGLAGAVGVGLMLGRAEWDLVALLSRLAGCELALHLLFVQFPDRAAEHGEPPVTSRAAALMLAGHLLALVLTACWLRCGETALWNLLRLAAGRVRAVLILLAAAPAALPSPVRAPLVLVAPGWLAGPAALLPAHRGPPPLGG